VPAATASAFVAPDCGARKSLMKLAVETEIDVAVSRLLRPHEVDRAALRRSGDRSAAQELFDRALELVLATSRCGRNAELVGESLQLRRVPVAAVEAIPLFQFVNGT
jgi:hypothetical protein